MLEKLKSRKFWCALLTMLLGILTALAEIGGTVGTVCGIVIAALAPIIYIIVEGNIDAKAVDLMKNATIEIGELIEDMKNTENTETE